MILEVLKTDLIAALKAKDSQKALVIRYINAQLKNYEIELRVENKELTDSDALLVLKRQIKKRNKALEQYRLSDRTDIIEKEEAELAIVEDYYNRFSQDIELPA